MKFTLFSLFALAPLISAIPDVSLVRDGGSALQGKRGGSKIVGIVDLIAGTIAPGLATAGLMGIAQSIAR